MFMYCNSNVLMGNTGIAMVMVMVNGEMIMNHNIMLIAVIGNTVLATNSFHRR